MLRRRLDDLCVPYLMNPSHIVPVIVGDADLCRHISGLLMDHHGIYIQPINYPTVPRGTERLRITISPLHSEADIEHLVAALAEIWSSDLRGVLEYLSRSSEIVEEPYPDQSAHLSLGRRASKPSCQYEMSI